VSLTVDTSSGSGSRLRGSQETATDERRESPDWVRLSYASALALRLVSGRFRHSLSFGGINILTTYEQTCLSDCGYCGLARSRPVRGESERSFIRVEWPLLATDELCERLVRYEDTLTRLCISMVTHGRAFTDTLELTRRLHAAVRTPLSVLIAPPVVGEARLQALHDAGANMIGIGLDAVTEALFFALRTDVPHGGLRWDRYWETVDAARRVFGPWQVNCHTLVGIGETDADLVHCFETLLASQVYAYLFCFNPEPDSRMASQPRPSQRRWRRIQLAKFLLEERGLSREALRFDDDGGIAAIQAPLALIDEVIADGHAFMTNGCPAAGGTPGCTRPMGSWRAAETPRDFPWRPDSADLAQIRAELEPGGLIRRGPWPRRDPALCAPPVAGRVPDTGGGR
jgi:biotin synthase